MANALTNTQIGPGSFGAPPVPAVPPVTQTKDTGQIPFQDAQNPLIVTSKTFQKGLNESSTALDSSLRNMNPNYPYPAVQQPQQEKPFDASTFSDGFTQQLDAMSQRSNDSTKALIASIHAARANQQGQIDQKYEQYTRGLQLLGIEKGTAAATPELLSGQLIQAENEHQQKISKLNSDETKALIDAQQARDDGDLKLMKEKMDYVQTIAKQKTTALKDYYDTLTAGNKASEGIAASVYDKVQGIDPAQREEYLMKVADAYRIPYDTLVSSLTAEKQNRDKASLQEENIRSEIANRGGSGGKPLTPSALMALKKQNPIIDTPYGTTSEEAQQYVETAKNWIDAINKDSNDAQYVRDGRLTYDYVKTAIQNLPIGIDKIAFLTKLYGEGKLTPKLSKHASDYGISKSEAEKIMGI